MNMSASAESIAERRHLHFRRLERQTGIRVSGVDVRYRPEPVLAKAGEVNAIL